MRQSLILQPIHLSSVDILKRFTLGEPLTPDQMHYIDLHQKQLSSQEFDPIYRYYIDNAKKRMAFNRSFLLTEDELTPNCVKQLKKRIGLFLQSTNTRVTLHCSQKQFLQFQTQTATELIFWHGNQALTGAPYFPGGIPPVLLFQWGNFFGVVKYVIVAGEKSFKANILIYFEDMGERLLDQCVENYYLELKKEHVDQQQLIHQHEIDTELSDHYIIKPPTLMPQWFKTSDTSTAK